MKARTGSNLTSQHTGVNESMTGACSLIKTIKWSKEELL